MKLGLDTASFYLATGLGSGGPTPGGIHTAAGEQEVRLPGRSASDWRPNESAPMRMEHFLRKATELGLGEIVVSDLRLLERSDYGYLSALRRTADADSLTFQLTYRGVRSDHLQDVIRAAQGMGSTLVAFFPEFERPSNEDAFQDLLDELATMLSRTLPIAERYEITIALAGGGVLTLDELLETIKTVGSDAVSVCLDPASALLVLEDPLDWAQALGTRVAALRLSDYQPFAQVDGVGMVCCPFGEGVIDVMGLVDAVRDGSPEAHIAITTPSEVVSVPLLDEAYLRRLQYATPTQMARLLRLARDRGLKGQPELPQDSDMTEDEVLATEDERFEQSLEWLTARMRDEG